MRATASGISGAFDPWGRVLSVADYFAAGERTMNAQAPVGRVPTVYARIGDLFAWLCVVGLVLAVGVAAVAPVKRSAQEITNRSQLVHD